MTELRFNIPGDFLYRLNDEPELMVFFVAFGVPLFVFIFAITFTRIYKNTTIAKRLNTVIFSTLLLSWLPGVVITLILLVIGISGIKLLLSWLSLLAMAFVFSVSNTSAIIKFSADLTKSQRFKSKAIKEDNSDNH